MAFKLWLDCDGVLADFDTRFEQITGEPTDGYEDRHGTRAFWKVIKEHENFFGGLPLMSDAQELFDAVKHLDPTILTGIPQGDWSQHQKLSWRDIYFPTTPMIVCPSKDKRYYMHPGKVNVIVDDLTKYKQLWEDAGGIFVLHTSTKDSLAKLKELGVL